MNPNCLASPSSGCSGSCTTHSGCLANSASTTACICRCRRSAPAWSRPRRADPAEIRGRCNAPCRYRCSGSGVRDKWWSGNARSADSHRGIFDDGHRRFVRAKHDVAVGPGLRQVGGGRCHPPSPDRSAAAEVGCDSAPTSVNKAGAEEQVAASERQGKLLIREKEIYAAGNVALARRCAKSSESS